MTTSKVDLGGGWNRCLSEQFEQNYMRELQDFLRAEKQAGKIIYPASNNVFQAFRLTPLEQVKVVLLGQDPYHGPGQAQGLSFAVSSGMRLPPSLRNIYQELKDDLGIVRADGALHDWAQQGVLLLNSVLTVTAGNAASHQGKGWERFTDYAITCLNQECEGLVFILWGRHAQRKGTLLDEQRHFVISSPHPSPLSAHAGFFGSCPFSRCNAYLVASGKTPVYW